ncbi:branched-chain amino acid transport system 2 carrier protein [Halopseudomonas oceani]|uniref:Branched-chain amino acid transport system carrier protein n=1 Tax=Halopseudomonas oceani TaxID=1708783 RepID=A0A2P4EUN0_9GAMM|nr:branched-chain amino acid transport system II carrier protein [Halopseudomonas oceani]POB03186.1 branched-chain amino acid transport system II carrier protein [Halopseudomonas oceani]GGE49390.1 branched-chain amino acid transport system 2 carrier protein [Halopseudomonas oceani]
MTKQLTPIDVLALGFMTFALFLGAGNVIFPPSAGLAAGENIWPTAFGFLITAVGLPLLTLIALARVGGGLVQLTGPLGRVAGVLLSVLVYLAIGPLFATPRTAVVSYQIGVAPFVQDSWLALLGYSVVYFSVVIFLALKPGQLVDRIGKYITPVLLSGLFLLGIAALLFPAGEVHAPTEQYRSAPLIQGFLQGYLTMDTLGALVFGIVITTAIRDRQVSENRLITRYTVLAAVIAAAGLSMVYLALFYLGATSGALVESGVNGGQILASYVQHRFGTAGSALLALVIILACMTTAVGLLTACGEYFSRLLPVSYQLVVWVFGLFSMAVANQGLDSLISFSIPVLVGLYPLAIVLVSMSLLCASMARPQNLMRPAMLVTLVFGVIDGLKAAGLISSAGAWIDALPLSDKSLGWLLPVAVTLLAAILVEYLRYGSLRR